MRRIRVLRLVEQHVVDAAVELVENPGRVAAPEQRQSLGDEVVEIEGAEPRLLLLDLAGDGAREGEKRRGALDSARGAALVRKRDQARLLVEQAILQAAVDAFRDERLRGARLVVLREEDGQVVAEALVGIGGAGGARGAPRRASGPWSCRGASAAAIAGPFAGRQAVLDHGALDLGGRHAVVESRGRGGGAEERRQGLRAVETGALLHGAADGPRERIAGRLDADRAERRGQGGIVTGGRLGKHVRGRLGDEFGRLALVEHGEARRHVRLERHKVQEALAEGVDRLDLEAARRLDRAGEEAPRQLHLSGARPLAFELRQLGDQLRRRRASPSVRAARRRGSPCWRRPPW